MKHGWESPCDSVKINMLGSRVSDSVYVWQEGDWVIICISGKLQGDTADLGPGTQSWESLLVQRAIRTLKNFVFTSGVCRKRTVSNYSFKSVGSFISSFHCQHGMTIHGFRAMFYVLWRATVEFKKKNCLCLWELAIYNKILARNKMIAI